jgi:hypothetical protein
MINLKQIGHSFFPSFEKSSVNYFCDKVAIYLTLNVEYTLHIEFLNTDGSYLTSDIINLDISLFDTFETIVELHFYILNRIDSHNNKYYDAISSIIFEDGKDNFNDIIKDVSITYYIK